MSDTTWTPMHGGQPKPGDRVATPHDCQSDFAPEGTIRHDAPVLVTSVTVCTLGARVRGVRCDGSLIEWTLEAGR